MTMILGMLATVLLYTGNDRWMAPAAVRRDLPRRSLVLLAMAWTNRWHHLYWTTIDNRADRRFLDRDAEVWPGFFAAHFVYSYALVAITTGLLVGAVYRSSGVFRAQASIMLFGVLLPWVVNIIDMSQAVRVHPRGHRGAGLRGHGPGLPAGMFRYRLLDLTPVAWAAVVEGMDDAVMVIDREGRIVELNPAAERLSGRKASEVLGTEAARAFADWPALAARLVRVEEQARRAFELDRPGREPPRGVRRADLAGWAAVVQRPAGCVVLRDISTLRSAERGGSGCCGSRRRGPRPRRPTGPRTGSWRPSATSSARR